ncbi:MAG: hypothetical protein JSW39_22805 [Desulfobacterales bacterium]|nr:MAG: hypothetical protein JSW39_22805 [Desulfobacterales bacterium]
MAHVEKLLVFLASPSDVPTERRYVEQVVDQLNRTVANEKGVVLQVIRWENDAFPGYGMDAQALINEQIAAMVKYALFVGIMWNRLGAPTPRAESGTVEEFERAVQARAQGGQPQIWFYFRQAAAKFDTAEQLDQRRKVLAFKERVQTNGLPWTYKSPSEFRDKFRNQMVLWLNACAQERLSYEVNALKLLVSMFLTTWEVEHLEKLRDTEYFPCKISDWTTEKFFRYQIANLRGRGLIDHITDRGDLFAAGDPDERDVNQYYQITDKGRGFLQLLDSMFPQSYGDSEPTVKS